MNTIDTLGLTPEQMKLLELIYRMVGRRDAGWKFDASLIPVYVMQPLIGEYVEYLRELDANTAEEQQKCLDLFNLMLLREAA